MRRILIALAILCLEGTAAFAQAAHQNGAATGLQSAVTAVTTSAVNTTTGSINFAVVAVWDSGSGITPNACTDTAGNTYHIPATNGTATNGNDTTTLFYTYNGGSAFLTNASNTVHCTVTGGTASFMTARVDYYSNGKTSADPYDTGCTGTSTSATPTCGSSMTPGATNNLVFVGSGSFNGSGVWTAGTGYTIRETGSGTGGPVGTEDRAAPGGAITPTITVNGAAVDEIVGASFAVGSGGGGGAAPCLRLLLGVGCDQ